ncbi:fibronectin type III domain-containing protein [Geomonas oryzisoli]|uniref:Fibronectin type III domain-containing protein n=1 Tax=Geomonas oryzisoli TaxID=2847992 RepID=A0ABX8J407_9BACT|nr:fibronectin type III domain-containing protein [Geomonas oryzisoli]QWV91826.1 fibronectin type III domain-containing protein [Geomonas oryzisoli]
MGRKRKGGEKDEVVIRANGELITLLSKDPSILEKIYTLLPNLEKIQATHNRHRSIYHEFLDGARDKEGELETARYESISQMRMIRGIANLVGKHDPTIPEKLGMAATPSASKRTPSPPITPMNLKVVYHKNEVVARASGVKGVKSYEMSVCESDPLVESNWRHLTTSTHAKRIVLSGLTPGKMYYFRIRALTTQGEGPWSNFVCIMAI